MQKDGFIPSSNSTVPAAGHRPNLNGESLDHGVRLQLRFQYPYLLAVCSCLSLSFPIFKIETIINLASVFKDRGS